MTALDIRGSGTSFAIMQGSVVLAGPYTSHDNAVAAIRGVETRLTPTRQRTCLCCTTDFTSRGHRLCPTCRKDAA